MIKLTKAFYVKGRTAADDAFDGVDKTGDVANGRYNKHVLVARVRRDRRQQLTVYECTHSNRYNTYVHLSRCPCLDQGQRPV